MSKYLLKLLLVIMASIVCWVFLLFPSIQGVLSRPLMMDMVKENAVELKMLADELNPIAASLQATRLEQIQQHYGFTLALRPVSQLQVTKQQLKQLRAGEAVAIYSDELSLNYLLQDGATVVSIVNPEEPAAHIPNEEQAAAMGAFWLVEQKLLAQPQKHWPAVIDELVERYEYDYSTEFLTLSELALESNHMATLAQGQVAVVISGGTVSAEFTYYKRIGDTDQVFTVGPMDSAPTVAPYVLIYFIGLAVMVLLPLILWLWPTARSMASLNRATQAFGQGDFDARAKSWRLSNIKELSATFNAMAERIQTLFNSHKLLTNSVSHDLRTPLSKLEFAIELLRSSRDDSERERQLVRMEDSLEQLNGLVTEMLLYAKFDREKPAFQLEPVEMAEWLAHEVGSLNETTDVEVACRCDDGLTVLLERYYMARVLANLIGNGIRYANRCVNVRFTVNAGNCCLVVEDDGMGIAPEDREKIFEPFVRLEESRNRDSGGTGLGLAIVRQVMNWQQGNIAVEQSDLGGAKFILKWPIQENL